MCIGSCLWLRGGRESEGLRFDFLVCVCVRVLKLKAVWVVPWREGGREVRRE